MTGYLRNVAIGFVLTGLATQIAAQPVANAADTTGTRTNFIIILADDLGYNDLGCFGSPLIDTPNVDRMAKEGARLTDFYTAPSCTPTRAALMTGSHPARAGFGDNLMQVGSRISPGRVVHPNSPFGINDNEITLPEVLKSAGYATGMVGKWHLGDADKFNPTLHGFDSFFGIPYSNDMKPLYFMRNKEKLEDAPDNDLLTKKFTEEAINFIRENKEKPFFLYLAHPMPHTPLGASPEFKGKSKRGPYGDAVEEVDWSVGQVLETLEECGIDDLTFVAFMSDNGPWHIRGENGGSAYPLRGAKGTTYEGGVRVPCVVRWPQQIPAGREIKEITTIMDFLPTFANAVGAVTIQDRVIDGKDIAGLLKGEHDGAVHDRHFYYFGNELHGVRSGKWKLRVDNYLENQDIYQKEWRDLDTTVTVPAALYNLELDPGEQKNVLNSHPKIEERLRGYIDEALKDLGDSITGKEGENLRPIGRR